MHIEWRGFAERDIIATVFPEIEDKEPGGITVHYPSQKVTTLVRFADEVYYLAGQYCPICHVGISHLEIAFSRVSRIFGVCHEWCNDDQY
jgi:hypothetical protein